MLYSLLIFRVRNSRDNIGKTSLCLRPRVCEIRLPCGNNNQNGKPKRLFTFSRILCCGDDITTGESALSHEFYQGEEGAGERNSAVPFLMLTLKSNFLYPRRNRSPLLVCDKSPHHVTVSIHERTIQASKAHDVTSWVAGPTGFVYPHMNSVHLATSASSKDPQKMLLFHEPIPEKMVIFRTGVQPHLNVQPHPIFFAFKGLLRYP